VDTLVPADGDDGVGRPWRADRESLRPDLDCDAADRRLPLVTLAFAALVLRERIMLLQWAASPRFCSACSSAPPEGGPVAQTAKWI